LPLFSEKKGKWEEEVCSCIFLFSELIKKIEKQKNKKGEEEVVSFLLQWQCCPQLQGHE
jgi:hypothetical protein